MKIILKTYLVIGIVIAAAVLNLLILYQSEQSSINQSYSIIKAGDLKVKAESVSALAISVASGNTQDKTNLDAEKKSFESILNALKNGGTVNGQSIYRVPQQISSEFNSVQNSWTNFNEKTSLVEKTMVFDPQAASALNYVLEKNGELILLSDGVSKDLQNLDRDFNRHKEIAANLVTCAQNIGRQTLLISIGESESSDQLKKESLKFEVNIRKLLGVSTSDLDLASIDEKEESLAPIPRENGASLRDLDPLWEAIKLKIKILEDRPLLSPDYNDAKNSMIAEKENLFSNVNVLLEKWNQELRKDTAQKQMIVEVLLGVDIILFIIVIFIIRQSLGPLEIITNALSRVKEGMYGEKIKYSGQDEIGNLVQTFNTMSDTIQEKEIETRKADTAKDEFLAMITHELKTPLVPIQGYVDLLLSEYLGKLNDRQKERLSIIKSSSENLLDIISDLLDVQKLELGHLRMVKENKDISETINSAVKILSPKFAESGIDVRVSSSKIFVAHDQARIIQVLTNLMKNSITAMMGKKGIIEVTVEDLGTQIRVNVRDNGTGIPADRQGQLFKKFYQVDTSLTRERGGSGLGLAICKGIVTSHGGQISVNSVFGQGATFSFTLPKSSESKTPISY